MKAMRFVVPAVVALCWTQEANAVSEPERAEPQQAESIVVTAPRRGEAEVPAESEFGEEEIAGYGADSVDELLDLLAPSIDASGGEPVILVNGKEIGFDRSILGYPPEVLDRIAVLKAEAAARYGHPSGQRIVNLVLKNDYASRHATASTSRATGGGQHGGTLTVSQVAVAGEVRWNVQGRVSYDSALRKSARGVPADVASVDLVGHVSPIHGDQIDPALSDLVGEVVTVAAIPAVSATRPPALSDFVAGANRTHSADPAKFETLLPSRRNLSLDLGASRPLGPFNASLSVNASSSRSERLRGVPMSSLVLPADSPWSPFSDEVRLVRPLAGDRALRGENSSRSLSLSLTLTGTVGPWRTTLAGSYARSWARNRLERGIDTSLAQALVNTAAVGFHPYAAWSDRLLQTTGSRSDSESFGLRFNVARRVLELPAGPVAANLSIDASRSSSGYRPTEDSDDIASADIDARRQLGGEISFSIPVSRPDERTTGLLGALTVDLSMGGRRTTGSGLRKQYGGGFTWSPVPLLEVLGAFRHREMGPSSEQLGAPRVEMARRVYDFVRQEVAEPLWITGGNPLLHRGSRRTFSLDIRLRPLGSSVLSVNLGYRQNSSDGGIASFPELTPAIEAAFPERVVRDAEGRLQVVDARPINLAKTEDAELVSAIALRLPAPGTGQANQRTGNPLRFSLSLNHTWRLKSELLTHPSVPVIDQLAETGQTRHYLALQANAGKKGIGADLNATWSSPARVRSRHASAAERDYRYEPPLMIDVGAFIVPDELWVSAEGIGWLENLRISFEIDNLLDTYRSVRLSDGNVPPGFSRYEVDPLGRTVELSVRKRF
ncbi:TonB-dependent receptor [Pelagerythrobacter rhizovicinus]|uniref:TonB-dependent receptor n=1 Tax=Pelagerythrobacter rhizovicinus TaxID=2268576 RepID=A0A4Q2KGT5_9SPHN|nr:hypothetical protein [Pelagerythrobacter rhizovicinus]RXZ64295.1 hypothetical protein ETX26_10335 [Pelagerythrobacter rhizovicinus]